MIVTCVRCEEDIYDCAAVGRDFAGAAVVPEDFTPLIETDPQPEAGTEMKCPRCGEDFFVPQRDPKTGAEHIVLRVGRAWWPHPPIYGVDNEVES